MKEKLKNFYLETYGCKLNQADSDLIRGILIKNFFREVECENKADFVILNSCGVIQKTERKIIKRAKKLKQKGKKVIITGCLPLISPQSCRNIADKIIGPKEIEFLPQVISSLFENQKLNKSLSSKLLSIKTLDKAKLFSQKKRNKKSVIAIVAIAEGCLGNCAYCATRLARGKLQSFSFYFILKEIKNVLKEGFKEIQLTSQDAACYGLDKGKLKLPSLLREISKIDKDFKVRVGMMNPKFVKLILKNLISVFKTEKIYKYLHLPLQSGDNKILQAMKRGYQKEDFQKIVFEFKKAFPNLLLATDIIVGFPGEDQKSFKKTLKIIKQVRPHILNITKFSPRKGTEAAQESQVPQVVKNERSKILNKLSEKIREEDNKKFLNKVFEVLITKKGKNKTFLARTDFYKAVIIKKGKIGEKAKIKIFNFKPNYLIGETLN